MTSSGVVPESPKSDLDKTWGSAMSEYDRMDRAFEVFEDADTSSKKNTTKPAAEGARPPVANGGLVANGGGPRPVQPSHVVGVAPREEKAPRHVEQVVDHGHAAQKKHVVDHVVAPTHSHPHHNRIAEVGQVDSAHNAPTHSHPHHNRIAEVGQVDSAHNGVHLYRLEGGGFEVELEEDVAAGVTAASDGVDATPAVVGWGGKNFR